MGLADIEKKIIEEAEAEARKVKDRTAEEAARIEAAAKKAAEAERRQIMDEARQKAEEEKKTILVPVRLAAKARLLQEKHRILEEVFAGIPPEVREKKEIEVAKSLYG